MGSHAAVMVATSVVANPFPRWSERVTTPTSAGNATPFGHVACSLDLSVGDVDVEGVGGRVRRPGVVRKPCLRPIGEPATVPKSHQAGSDGPRRSTRLSARPWKMDLVAYPCHDGPCTTPPKPDRRAATSRVNTASGRRPRSRARAPSTWDATTTTTHEGPSWNSPTPSSPGRAGTVQTSAWPSAPAGRPNRLAKYLFTVCLMARFTIASACRKCHVTIAGILPS